MGTGLSLVMVSADNSRHKGILTANGCARVAVEVTFWHRGFPDAKDRLYHLRFSTKPTYLLSLFPIIVVLML